MNTILLQITDSLIQAPISDVPAKGVTIWDLTLKGGIFMIPIALLSVFAIYILVERWLLLRQSSANPDSFMQSIRDLVMAGNLAGAKSLCQETNSPISRLIEKGISKLGSPLKVIEASIENQGKLEIFKLEKGLPTMASIAGAAPMLGFLGTVTGMIQAFIAIAQEEGNVSPALLASGIYEAMITTAAGLIVGIPTYIGYNYLVTRVTHVIHQMQSRSVEFIDLLQEPKE